MLFPSFYVERDFRKFVTVVVGDLECNGLRYELLEHVRRARVGSRRSIFGLCHNRFVGCTIYFFATLLARDTRQKADDADTCGLA